MNPICAICLGLFDGRNIVATPCGHVFHARCLSGPCEDSELCPVCQVEIAEENILKIKFFTGYDAAHTKSTKDFHGLTKESKEREADILVLKKRIKQFKSKIVGIKQLCRTLLQKYSDERKSCMLKQQQVDLLKAEVKDLSSRHTNFANAVIQFSELNVLKMIRGTVQEAGEARHLQARFAQKVGDQIARSMTMLCRILKYEFDELHAQNDRYLQQLIRKDTQLLEVLQRILDLQVLLRNQNARNRDVGFN